MRPLQMAVFVLLVAGNVAQAHGPCVRAFTDTPIHERIFLPKALVKQPTVADLTNAPISGDTNLIARLFNDASKERAGGARMSLAPEVPLHRLTVNCARGLLNPRDVAELLNCTVIVPREFWLEHQSKRAKARYVFTLSDVAGEKFTVDLREGGCAVVFFPDGTYHCIMDQGYNCVRSLQPAVPTNAAPPNRSR